MLNRKTTQVLILILITVAVYAGSLRNDFAWDDKYLIVDNPYIKNWAFISHIFKTDLYEAGMLESNYFRPIQLLTYMIDYAIWGLAPCGYHMTNLLLHASNTCLVYVALIIIGASPGAAFLTGLFFSICPANSIGTYYISSRADLLMGFFLLGSFIFFSRYLKEGKKADYIYSIILFILGLLAREAALVLPGLLALELFRQSKARQKIRSLWPYILILLVYMISRAVFLDFSKYTLFNLPGSDPLKNRLLTNIKVLPEYIRILIMPYDLHMERYIEPVSAIFSQGVLVYLLAAILIVWAVRRLYSKNNLVLFGACWFMITILPVLNIYPLPLYLHDGWLYMPSIGFFIIVNIALFRIIRSGLLRVILMVFIALYYVLFTVSYGCAWKNTETLLSNVLKYEKDSPRGYLAYNNLGIYYDSIREHKKAQYCFKKSIALNHDFSNSINDLGASYAYQGYYVKAIKCFKKAISVQQDMLHAYTNLASSYNAIGFRDKALYFCSLAMNISPDYYKSYAVMGIIYSDKKDIVKSEEYFKKAVSLRNEDAVLHYNLGKFYMENNRVKEAIAECTKAIQLGYIGSDIYNRLGVLYIRDKNIIMGESMLARSIMLDKHDPSAYNNLGNLYASVGAYKIALDNYRRALEISPESQGVQENYNKTKHDFKKYILARNRHVFKEFNE